MVLLAEAEGPRRPSTSTHTMFSVKPRSTAYPRRPGYVKFTWTTRALSSA